MVRYRKKIPSDIQAKTLFMNDMTCCICMDRSKGVQIHHIDGNPNNNDPNNLAVVCTDHQDKIHKLGGITKGISPEVLKKYKHDWELTVRRQRTERYGRPLKTSLEKALFKFEIRKTCYEIVTLNDDDIDGIIQRLDFLDTLSVLEVSTNQILQNLEYVLVLFVFGDKNKARLIANKIPEFFCSYLMGPKVIKISEETKASLELAIRIIGTIGDSAAILHDLTIMKRVSSAFEKIWEILILYNLESYALKVLCHFDEILRLSSTSEDEHEPFAAGIDEISKLRQRLKAMTEEKQPRWENVLARLNKLVFQG